MTYDMISLSNLGEIGLIKKIRNMLPVPHGGLKVGPGDDAALFKAPSKDILTTTDMLVEGVHFDFKTGSAIEIGWNAMAANLSDIAAMGGWPSYAVAAIAARAGTATHKIISICRGMIKLANRFNCQIIGGDIVSTPGPLTISIAVIGSPFGKKAFLRSSARPGDKILVTGLLGNAELALRKRRIIKIIPRLEEIKYLSQKIRINALIDLSDGLSSDLARVSEESNAGARIFEKNLPAAASLKKMKKRERLNIALNGGEDFELLLTTPEKNVDSLILRFKTRFKIPLSIIGEIMPKAYGIKIVHCNGIERKLKPKGYEHFK